MIAHISILLGCERVPWDIAGHGAVVAAVKAALIGGMVGHAYMLVGPRGIGKARFALHFAKALLCESAINEVPCGNCRSCRLVQSGNHPDLHLISPDGNSLRIDQIRELQAQIALRPFAGRYKVCIIDDADTMTEQAQNSMLKSLEEPPGSGVFILVAHNPGALLATIHSRCQVLRMQLVPEGEIAALLQRERNLPASEAALLAALSDGRPGYAMSLDLQSAIAQRDQAIAWCASLRQDGLKGVIKVAEELEKAEDLPASLSALSMWLHDLWHVYVGSGVVPANRDRKAALQQEAPGWGAAAMQALQAVNDAKRLLARNANKRLVFDCMLMQIQRGLPS